MKKHEAVEKLDRVGDKIHGLHSTAWNVALNPTRHGWASSIAGIASLPILGAASVGHLVSSAIVKQIGDDTFERLTEFPGKDTDKRTG